MIVRGADIAEFKELKKKGLSNSEIAYLTGFGSSTVHVYTSKTNGLKECEKCGKQKQKALYSHCVGDEIVCKSCLRKQRKENKRKYNENKSNSGFMFFMGEI